jgi:uncharacterized delta-60 repeat protein
MKHLQLLRSALLTLALSCCVSNAGAGEESTVGEIYSLIGQPGAVTQQPDGKIVIASGSHLYWLNADQGTLGMMSSGAFRFNQDGTLDRSFRCNIDTINLSSPHQNRLVCGADGRLLMAGRFSSIDGLPRPRYAMLLPDGRVDASFEPWRDFTNQSPPPGYFKNTDHYTAALLTNGCVAVYDNMLEAPKYPTAFILNPFGRYVSSAKPSAIRSKFTKGISSNFRQTGFGIGRSIDWEKNTRTKWEYWQHLEANDGLLFPLWGDNPTALDMSEALTAVFEEVPVELCRYAARLPDGGCILAVQDHGGSRFMRFDKNWRPDLSYTNHFEAGPNSDISLAVQPDGKLLVAGKIYKLNGETFSGLARLDKNGATDRTFNCHPVGGLDAVVMGFHLQADGRILIVGLFSQVNGVDCPHFARINPDGSLDESFQRHFTSFKNLNAMRRVKVYSLAASTPQKSEASMTNIATAGLVNTPVQTVLITSFNIANGVALLEFKGNANSSYVLQAASDLSQPNWISIGTSRTDMDGNGDLRDEDAKNHPLRFYRVATP